MDNFDHWLATRLVFAFSLLAAGFLPHAAGQTSAQTSNDKPVAVIGGEAIYDRDYLPQIQSQVYRVRMQEFELKRKALEAAINRKLLRAEAAKRGITEEELLRQEADSKVPEPSDSEVEQKLVIQMFRGGMPSNTSKEQIAQELKQGKIEQARGIYFAGLRERAGVRIFLSPPRHDVSPDPARIRGTPDAPITIVEFSDFQCPFCYQAYYTIKNVLAKYGAKVKLSYRDMPLAGAEADPNGTAAAARCAGEQGKYWEYHDLLFENQDDIGPRAFREFAGDLTLDSMQFESCLESAKFRASIQEDFQEGLRLGITGTPFFFINGIPVNGALPQPVFEEIIETELALLAQKNPVLS
jgi:protein-disulfide isomerase